MTDGRHATLPVDDDLEVAVYGDHPDRSDAPPLSLVRVPVRGGADISVVVDALPGYVVIDPHLRRIDRNPDDNRRRIEGPAGK